MKQDRSVSNQVISIRFTSQPMKRRALKWIRRHLKLQTKLQTRWQRIQIRLHNATVNATYNARELYMSKKADRPRRERVVFDGPKPKPAKKTREEAQAEMDAVLERRRRQDREK